MRITKVERSPSRNIYNKDSTIIIHTDERIPSCPAENYRYELIHADFLSQDNNIRLCSLPSQEAIRKHYASLLEALKDRISLFRTTVCKLLLDHKADPTRGAEIWRFAKKSVITSPLIIKGPLL